MNHGSGFVLRRDALVFLLALLCFGRPLNGREALPPLQPLKADRPPVLDGVLDDAAWQAAPQETGFKTWRPDFGKDMQERTIVYYAYDRENLYFAFRCFDSQPSKIKAAVSGRDSDSGDDWICINLDTFNDQQSLYAFYVNPLGVQSDSRFEGGLEDFNVDVVWYSEGRIDEQGYAIEMRIPFKSIRYAGRNPVAMGVIFERSISRLSEAGTYPALDPAQGENFLTQTRTLLLEDIRHYTLLEVLPGATFSQGSVLEQGRLKAQKGKADPSLTGKYGLTSQLILDGTFNPDFSQVESDAGQVDFNLRYALYYPEKRPFFLEGQEKFNFGAGQPGNPLESVVYTRTIIDPRLGLKLTGKVSGRDTLASIYALDDLLDGADHTFAHFSILRYKHALRQDSFLGGFMTGRFEGGRYNVVAGGDGQFRLNPSSLMSYHAFLSQTRPDGTAAGTSGHALGFLYEYYTRDLLVQASLQDLDKDFETDVGYMTRNGLTRLRAGLLPMIYPKSKLLLRIDPLFHSTQIRDKFSGLWETDNSFDLRLLFPRNTTILAGYKYATEVYRGERLKRSNFRIRGSSQVNKQLRLSVLYFYGQKIRYMDDPYQGRGTDLQAELAFVPSDKLHFGLSFTYSDFTRSADSVREYDYTILRNRNTYQVNKYLFFRAILEYNTFRRELMTDFLASFTYIPGTVIYLGYGSLYEKIAWQDGDYVSADRFLETRRGFFFKASYLWRL